MIWEGVQRSKALYSSEQCSTGYGMVTFVIWQLKGAGVRGGSIYGVTDDAKPSCLPTFPKGHWERFRLLSEDRFPGAAEVRQSIEAHGYYIFGGKLTLTETERVVVGGRY